MTVSAETRVPRAVLFPFAMLGTAIGWSAGRFLLAIGWVAGRIFLIGAFFTEAVIFGFRQGAMLGPKLPPEPPLDNSKVLTGPVQYHARDDPCANQVNTAYAGVN